MPYRNVVGIIFALLVAQAPAYAGPPPAIQQHGCENCHRFSADHSPPPNKAPDLFYAGDKFRKNWLKKFLKHPVVIRKAGYFKDPGFLLGQPVISPPHAAVPPGEAETIAEYLSSLKLPGPAAEGTNPPPLSKEEKAKAKFFFERRFGCSSCHQAISLAKKVRGGISGPSLVNAGNRLRAGWVFRWLKNPKPFQPKGRMPVYNLPDEEALLITRYIMTLKKEHLK